MIAEDPSRDLKVGSMANPARNMFIGCQMIRKVIDAAPDAEWRLLIVLGRIGGLRIPSEALALRWAHVDWERSRLRVCSRKTEHLEGGGERVIPLFPELRDALMEAFELADEGAEWVIGERYRTGCGTLNPQLRRIIRRAGLVPWPRAWHNLRASRATELAQEYPGHVAAAWLGHTEAIADIHYRMVREEDYERAIGGGGVKPDARAAQNAALHRTGVVGTTLAKRPQTPKDAEPVRTGAEETSPLHDSQMTPRGFEPRFPG